MDRIALLMFGTNSVYAKEDWYIHPCSLSILVRSETGRNVGSSDDSHFPKYANRAITTVYTNRNTQRNFIQKSENHTPSPWLRIFSSLTTSSSSLQGIAQASLALLLLRSSVALVLLQHPELQGSVFLQQLPFLGDAVFKQLAELSETLRRDFCPEHRVLFRIHNGLVLLD